MKKLLTTILLTVFILISIKTISYAQDAEKQIGIGVMVGEPTGVSFKYWMNEANAIDAGLAWSLGRYDAVNIHADYLWHNYDVFEDVDSGTLPLYYGVGGRLVGDNKAILGVRGPVGLNYLFEDAPIGLFFEVVPIFNLLPSTYFDLDGALGFRFYLDTD